MKLTTLISALLALLALSATVESAPLTDMQVDRSNWRYDDMESYERYKANQERIAAARSKTAATTLPDERHSTSADYRSTVDSFIYAGKKERMVEQENDALMKKWHSENQPTLNEYYRLEAKVNSAQAEYDKNNNEQALQKVLRARQEFEHFRIQMAVKSQEKWDREYTPQQVAIQQKYKPGGQYDQEQRARLPNKEGYMVPRKEANTKQGGTQAGSGSRVGGTKQGGAKQGGAKQGGTKQRGKKGGKSGGTQQGGKKVGAKQGGGNRGGAKRGGKKGGNRGSAREDGGKSGDTKQGGNRGGAKQGGGKKGGKSGGTKQGGNRGGARQGGGKKGGKRRGGD